VFTPRIANAKICVPRTAKVRELNLRAECHGPDSSAVFNRTAAVRSKGVINHEQSADSRGGVQIRSNPYTATNLDPNPNLDPTQNPDQTHDPALVPNLDL
jgi:hypothetical protein